MRHKRREPDPTEDLTCDSNEYLLAGSDVDPIAIRSETHAIKEIEFLSEKISQGVDWDEQVNAIKRAMGLINGGILNYDGFVKNLIHLYPGLSSAVVNLRSTLVKTTCLLICQLVRELKFRFEQIGDLISPLSTRLSHGTKVIAESCRQAILCIVRNCGTRKILSSVLDLCGARGPAQKSVAAECVVIVIHSWPSEAIGTNWPRLTTTIEKLLTAATPECRAFGRQAAKGLKKVSRERFTAFSRKLDIRIKCAIDAEPDVDFERLTLFQCGIGVDKDETLPPKPLPAKRPKKTSRLPLPPKRKPQPVPVEPEIDEEEGNASEDPGENTCDVGVIPEEDTRVCISARSIQLVEGREKQFIHGIREFTDSGRMSDLASNIENISIDLIRCCIDCTTPTGVAALAITHDLIPEFRELYRGHLPTLLELLFIAVEQGCPRAVATAHLILDDLPNIYECSLLVDLVGEIHTTCALIQFISNLVDNRSVQFSDDHLCCQLLDVAKRGSNLDDNKTRQAAAHIADAVYTMNEPALLSWCEDLGESEIVSFEAFLKPYIPEIVLGNENSDFPRYDGQDLNAWISSLSEFISDLPDRDWRAIRFNVYQDISRALLHCDDPEETLRFVQSVVHERGSDDFGKLLPGVLRHGRNSAYKKIVENILMMFKHSIPVEEIISALDLSIRHSDLSICVTALQFQAMLLKSSSKMSVNAMLPSIVPPLCDLFQSTKPEIRKAALQCLVELHLISGNAMKQLTQNLSDAQKKLIAVYLARHGLN